MKGTLRNLPEEKLQALHFAVCFLEPFTNPENAGNEKVIHVLSKTGLDHDKIKALKLELAVELTIKEINKLG